MCYVVLQTSFGAVEDDIMVLLDLLTNQEEIFSENAKRKKKVVPKQEIFWLSSAFENIKNIIFRINCMHWALEVFHFNVRYWQI